MKLLIGLFITSTLFGANFTADKQTQTIIQSQVALMWQDDEQVSHEKMSYKSAMSYCESLGLNDMTDWRMPTRQELVGIVDKQRTPTVLPIFAHTASECYWTMGKESTNWVGFIDFSTGKSMRTIGLDHSCFVRCVRKIK